MSELRHDFVDLTHWLQSELGHRTDQDLTLHFVDLKLLSYNTLNEFDFISQDFVLFVQLSKHELFPEVV